MPTRPLLQSAAAAAFLSVLAAGLSAQTMVLRGATLIDGTDRPPRRDAVVVVRNGWITAVGDPSDVAIPRGARILDLTGKYLLPGFVEMHGHLAIAVWEVDTTGGTRRLRYPYDEAATVELTRTQLAFGITTVRNPAGPTREAVSLRNRVRLGELVGPRIVTAGAPIDRSLVAEAVDQARTPEDVRAAVARQAEAGVDFIKLYSTLDSAMIRAGVDEAHARGLPAVAHLWQTSWTDAASAGLDAITHIIVNNAKLLPEAAREEYLKGMRAGGGQFMFDWFGYADFDGPEIREMIDTLVSRRISVDPTLVAFEWFAWADDTTRVRPEVLQYLPPTLLAKAQAQTQPLWNAEDLARAKRNFARMLELARRLHRAGVPLTVGTDGANPWLYHRELELLVEAGIPPADVLRMATRNAARALRLTSEIGTVEVGRRADLVVLDADPAADIRNTRRIAWVVRDGRPARPEEFLPERLRRQ